MFAGSESSDGSSIASPETDRAMAVMATLFFTWGFARGMKDILIPHLQATFNLTYAEVMLVQISFFSAYLFAIPCGRMICWIGYKKTIVTALITMGVGALLFVPAASVPSFRFFLLAVLIIATGITALQVAANPYVAGVGHARTAASRLNLVQGFNSLGRTVAPLIVSMFLLSVAPKAASETSDSLAHIRTWQLHQASRVKLPYVGLALAVVILAVVISRLRLPSIPLQERNSGDTKASVYKQSRLLLGAVGIFVYVGAETAIGGFLVKYLMQPGVGNLPQKTAGFCVAIYWGTAMVGRFLGSALLRRIPTGKLLGIFSATAAVLIALSLLSTGLMAMWSMLLVGICNSIMFPSIFALAIEGLGPLTAKGSGLLLTATVGGAIIPELQGLLADRIGLHSSFVLPVICYLYIVHFALRGSAIKSPAPDLLLNES
jgi:FHS family L-fucose permease-like MFS transporter